MSCSRKARLWQGLCLPDLLVWLRNDCATLVGFGFIGAVKATAQCPSDRQSCCPNGGITFLTNTFSICRLATRLGGSFYQTLSCLFLILTASGLDQT